MQRYHLLPSLAQRRVRRCPGGVWPHQAVGYNNKIVTYWEAGDGGDGISEPPEPDRTNSI